MYFILDIKQKCILLGYKGITNKKYIKELNRLVMTTHPANIHRHLLLNLKFPLSILFLHNLLLSQIQILIIRKPQIMALKVILNYAYIFR